MIAQLDSAEGSALPSDDRMPDSVFPYVRAGFACHWLRERSKAPVDQGWSSAPVASEDALRASYRRGYNVGVRLGEPSQVAGGYLYLIDADIRDTECADEARETLRDLLGVDPDTLPTVASGSGGESRHYYFVSDRPFHSRRLAVSGEKIRRFDKTRGKEVWSYTWELELFGTNKHVAMPPSIHPDTGKPYVWLREFDLDMLDLGVVPTIPAERLSKITDPVLEDYEFEAVEPLTFKPGQLEAELDEIGLERIDDYHDWVTLGQALHHQFGGSREGFDLWVKHSRRSEKFDPREMPHKWRSFGRSRRRPVTMASVRQWILEERRQAFVAEMDDAFDDLPDEPEGIITPDTLTADVAALLGGDNIRSADVNDPLDADVDPLDKPVELPWQSLLDFNPESGAIKPHLHNIALIVQHDPRSKGLAQFNLFTQEIVQRASPAEKVPDGRKPAKPIMQLRPDIWAVRDPLNGTLWNDRRDDDLRRVLEAPKSQGGYGIKISDRDLTAAIGIAAQAHAFHPVREYLEGLSWDGKARAETLFIDYLGADDDAYSREIARLMLVAAVTRIYEPGHKWDQAVVIEGIQGRGKSTFIQALGKHWAVELDGDFGDMKQMIELLQGAWIVELPELSAFSKSDVRAIKAFISRQEDRARLAYARRASGFPRQSVFVGSTNNSQYLSDPTGARRFWPIRGNKNQIDLTRFVANVDQIWAEALTIYRTMRENQPTGTLPLYLTGEASQKIALQNQSSRTLESSEAVMAGEIAVWLDKPVHTDAFEQDTPTKREITCLKEIWCDCLGEDSSIYAQGKAQLVGRAMELVPGWEKTGQPHDFPKYGRQRAFRRVYERKAT
jgi:predicted P-loop ATPase